MSAQITLTLHVKDIFVFHLFNVFLRFRSQSAKKACLRFAIFNFSEKLQNIFEIGLKKIWSDRTKIALERNVFRNKKFSDIFLVFIC